MGEARAEDDKAMADTVISDERPNLEHAQDEEDRPTSELPRAGGSSAAVADVEPPEELVGLDLDHFHIQRRLGQGGMGTVYEARDESLDRRVALKLLRDDLTDRPGQETRFLREARAQARLNHPNVVQIHYIGHRPARDDGRRSLYFAMELIDGESLSDLLDRDERLEPEEARTIMIQVAEGLRAANRAGIIHRDVKPSNLMRDQEGRVKIADFGLALPVEAERDVRITQDGAMVGSPLYMSPEQARDQDLDFRTDMYSLGASFFHLLAGRPPFEGTTGLSIVAQHLSEAPPRLREVRADVPLALADIVDRLLAKDPARRYDDYDALIEALERAAPGRRHFAGFWTRGAAVLIDSLLATGLIWAIGWPGLVLHVVYVTVAHAIWGQTFAKFFLRIRVHRRDGTKLGFLRSAARTVLSVWAPVIAGALILWYQGASQLEHTIERLNPEELEQLQSLLMAIGISNGFLTLLWGAGLAMAAFHPAKRAIHDLAVGSVVTYRFPDD